jgi:hypothetical protein
MPWDIDARFAEPDRCSDIPFRQDRRREPPMRELGTRHGAGFRGAGQVAASSTSSVIGHDCGAGSGG